MVIINNYEEYKSLEGVMVGSSSWHTIDQEQIDRCAGATFDHQWIYMDRQKDLTDQRSHTAILHFR